MSTRNLSFLMQPGSVALVGVGKDRGSLAAAVAHNVREAGFKGELFATGTECRSLDGISSCRTIEGLPHPPDLAVICSDPDSVPNLVSSLGSLGAKAAIILAGEEGTGGIERCGELRVAAMEAAEPYPMRLLGFSSFGVLVPGSSLNASLAHVQALKGNLAFVTQSGGVLATVLDWATSRGIGFSHLASLGTMVDVDFGDMLDYLANDYGTQAILLHVEEVTHARKFMSAARMAARMKPVIVLKGGHRATARNLSEDANERAALEDAVYAAAFRRAGMLRVFDIQELFDAVQTLSKARSLTGDRLAILTNSRGVGLLAADALADARGRLAELAPDAIARLSALLPACWSIRNPVDLQEDGSGGLYAQALQILMEDGGTDGVLVLHAPGALSPGAQAARTIIEHLRESGLKTKSTRLFTSWLGEGVAAESRRLFAENGILTYETPTGAVRGFMQVVRYRRNQEMLMETVPSIPEAFSPDTDRVRRVVDGSLAAGKTRLKAIDAKNVLDAYGLRTQGSVPPRFPHELAIRVAVDERFGPVIFVGQGGTSADLIGDMAPALPPLNLLLAREAIRRTRIARRLDEPAEAASGLMDGTALAMVKVSQLVCDVPEIAELELNPLVFDDQGIVALGAQIRIDAASDSDGRRPAIRPYPRELEEHIVLPDGHRLLLRPIRPEDEPAYQRLFAALPPEDVFLRFMNPMKVLPHSLAARLTQLDYDREMALVLIDEQHFGEAELCGGVRITADADNDRAEFAIMLRRDMTGLGLGPLMMRRIIDYARKRGIREVYGEVLSENTPMLRLCRALGFSTKRMPEDPGIIIATLAL
ncbi:MAG: bifunctional acetate--CoA ligase family protein/GNAT family N-acetyltransferase [Syntrophobacteraceae bacterium]